MEESNQKTKPKSWSWIRHFSEYWLRDTSFNLLLVVLIFAVFVLPILMDFDLVGLVFFNWVFLFLFFTGIWSSQQKSLIIITATLFLIQLILKILRMSEELENYYLLERIFGILNMSVFIYLNFRLLFRDQEISSHRIVGAINVYLSLAVLGAFIFEVIHLQFGSSIGGESELSGIDQDYGNYIYFSLVSLTTVGFGEFYPENVITKMISVFLSTVGLLYPAVVIARLISHSRRSIPLV